MENNIENSTESAPIKPKRSIKKHVKKLAKKPTKKSAISGLLVILVLVCAGMAVYFYKQYRDVSGNPNEAVAARNKEETQAVLNNLKSIIIIEETEQPTVARVDDPEKLKKNNPEFYKNIQKDDYLILFPKRAIIYRQSTNKIVNIAPIIDTSEAKSQSENQQPTDTQNTNN